MSVTMPRSIIAATILVLFLSAASIPAHAIRLKYNCKAGDVSNYKMTMMGTTQLFVGTRIQETVLTTEMFLTQRVEDVSNTGIITVGTSIDSGKVVVNGMPSVLPYVGRRVISRMLRNGEIIAGTSDAANFNNSQLIFPDRNLKIGSTWEATLPPNNQVPVPLKVRYTYLGKSSYKQPDGKLLPCIKVKSEVLTDPKATQSPGMRLKVKAEGTILFDHKRGRMVRNAVDSNMEMILKRKIQNVTHTLITRMKMAIILELQY